MATYSPEQVNVKAPQGGFQTGGWYEGRQYWNGTLSDPGVIHPASNQQGAGQAVSAEVNAASAKAQGVSPQNFESYLQKQRDQSAGIQGVQQVAQARQQGAPKSTGSPTGGAGVGFDAGQMQPPALNLPELYKSLYEQSGVSDLEKQYSSQEKQFIEAKGQINDNPFLSEATRVGRVAKLEELFNDRTANIRGQIETKKADIQMQLDLQTKQFDINSQIAQQALNQFTVLLDSGALDSASGEDIAAITRSTGLGSGLISSAIEARRVASLSTQVQTFDDGVDEGFIIYTIDPTGNIVNEAKQVTGKSSKVSTSQYSADPTVNAFIQQNLGGQEQSGAGAISSIYDDILEEEGYYGMSTNQGPVYFKY